MIMNMITIGCIAMAVHILENLIKELIEVELEKKDLLKQKEELLKELGS